MEDLEGTIRNLTDGLIDRDRREFLMRAVALGLTIPSAAAILAACGAAAGTSSATSSPTPMSTAKPARLGQGEIGLRARDRGAARRAANRLFSAQEFCEVSVHG
jgi:hypothetical protein